MRTPGRHNTSVLEGRAAGLRPGGLFRLALLPLLVIALVACETADPMIAVAITPTAISVDPGATVEFVAAISGSSSGVTWTASCGALAGDELLATYTAPATPGTCTVTVTSVADTTKAASAQVTVGTPQAVVVAISPATATLEANGSANFTAVVTGTANTGVVWAATCGTTAGTGATVTYTAPGEAGTCDVTAVSVADPTKSATARVTVEAAAGPNEWILNFQMPDASVASVTSITGQLTGYTGGDTEATMAAFADYISRPSTEEDEFHPEMYGPLVPVTILADGSFTAHLDQVSPGHEPEPFTYICENQAELLHPVGGSIWLHDGDFGSEDLVLLERYHQAATADDLGVDEFWWEYVESLALIIYQYSDNDQEIACQEEVDIPGGPMLYLDIDVTLTEGWNAGLVIFRPTLRDGEFALEQLIRSGDFSDLDIPWVELWGLPFEL